MPLCGVLCLLVVFPTHIVALNASSVIILTILTSKSETIYNNLFVIVLHTIFFIVVVSQLTSYSNHVTFVEIVSNCLSSISKNHTIMKVSLSITISIFVRSVNGHCKLSYSLAVLHMR